MDKISGILPSNARVTTVDLTNSGSARPGAPILGRQPGKSALGGDDGKTTAMKAMEIHRSQMQNRVVDQQRADMVQKLADGFFINQKSIAEKEVGLTDNPVEAVAIGELSDIEEYRSLDPVDLNREDDLDAPEVGRYIDVIA